MSSYQSFMPGRHANLRKLINYQTAKLIYCECYQEKYKKYQTAENDPNISSNIRFSNLIQTNVGSKIRFGNSYIRDNYYPFIDTLGSIEGQVGGSFKPLRNKF